MSGEEQGMCTSMVRSRAISGWCYTQCWFSDPKGPRACISTSETLTPRRPASYGNCNMEGYLLPRTALESLLMGLSLYTHIRCLSVAPCYGWAHPRLLSPQGPWARQLPVNWDERHCRPEVWVPSLVLVLIRKSYALRPQGASCVCVG